MRYDFSSVEDAESFVTVPEGEYRCRIAEVRPGQARDGSERWRMRLEVAEGQWAGRTAAWDSITWSERGIYRVKKVLEALGYDVAGEVVVDPDDLLELQALVQLETEEWEDPVTGRRQERMRVPYLGYRPVSDADGAEVRSGAQPGTGAGGSFGGGADDPFEDFRP